MTKLISMAVPILPGKTEAWKKWMHTCMNERSKEFKESRQNLGIRERAFLQQTPMGDFAIVTFEGENPETFLERFAKGTDSFTQFFVDGVKETSGFDLRQPMPGPIPELFVDSGAVVHEMTSAN